MKEYSQGGIKREGESEKEREGQREEQREGQREGQGEKQRDRGRDGETTVDRKMCILWITTSLIYYNSYCLAIKTIPPTQGPLTMFYTMLVSC